MGQSFLTSVVCGSVLLIGCSTAVARGSPQPIKDLTLGPKEARTVAVVRIQKPWWAMRFMVVSRFVDAVAQYALIPGLEYKAFTLSDANQFGGLYVWESETSAQAWFTPAWHERAQKKYGVPADLQRFEALWTVNGTAEANGEVLPQRAIKSQATVVLVLSEKSVDLPHQEEVLRTHALEHGLPPGLVRVSFIRNTHGRVGAAEVWATREAAESFWSQTRRSQAAAALRSPIEMTWFSAPVLLDAAQAKMDALAIELQSGAGDQR